jgi:pilus assembly protein CpaE
VLLAPPDAQRGELVTSDHLRAILDLMRREFDYVVVDTPASFQDRSLAVLDVANRIVTLMSLEMHTIRNITRFLEVADLLEYPREKVMLVLNKATNRTGIRAEEVEKTLQRKVSLQIGDAAQDMTFSINQGVPLVIGKPTHQISRDINSTRWPRSSPPPPRRQLRRPASRRPLRRPPRPRRAACSPS